MPARLQEVEQPASTRQVAPAKPRRAKADGRPTEQRNAPQEHVYPGQPCGNQDALDGCFRADDLTEPLLHALRVAESEIARSFRFGQPDSREPPERS